MAIQLSARAEALIAAQVAAGKFASADAFVDEALSLFEWSEERKAYERAWLEEKLARAMAQLERGEWVDAETFEARMDARRKARRQIAA